MRASARYVTCQVRGQLLGIPLESVHEINRMLTVTAVPRVAEEVRGVINLRGALVTVLDLGHILYGNISPAAAGSRNVIVAHGEEKLGLVVDQVGDVVDTKNLELEPLPSHVPSEQRQWFRGLHQIEAGVMLALDVAAVAQVGC